MVRDLFVTLSIVTLLGADAAAQPAARFSVGDRVRVWTQEHAPVTGQVLAAAQGVLELQPDSGRITVSVPLVAIRRAEISRGHVSRRRRALNGAKWGALILASAGAVSLSLQHEQVGPNGSSAGEAAALGAFSGGLFGGLAGAVVGAARSGDKWEPLYP